MSETSSHKRAKRRAAGKSGKTEKKIKYGGRIDVLTSTKAVEIERGGKKRIQQAIRRLERVRRSKRVLRVPKKNFAKAVELAKKSKKKTKKKITVTNLVGTKRRRV